MRRGGRSKAGASCAAPGPAILLDGVKRAYQLFTTIFKHIPAAAYAYRIVFRPIADKVLFLAGRDTKSERGFPAKR